MKGKFERVVKLLGMSLMLLVTALFFGCGGGDNPTNNRPVISGSPATFVTVGIPYSFVPTASDPDAGNVLKFSIANKPSWAAFNVQTGALTGAPTATDVGTTTGIVISVSDGALSASLPAFNLTVNALPVNHPPVISGSPALSVIVGTSYSFVPTASDPDAGNVLTFSIANKPSWAAFNVQTGALTGTPAATDVTITSGIVISVSDGTLSASLPAFDLTLIPVTGSTGSPGTGGF